MRSNGQRGRAGFLKTPVELSHTRAASRCTFQVRPAGKCPRPPAGFVFHSPLGRKRDFMAFARLFPLSLSLSFSFPPLLAISRSQGKRENSRGGRTFLFFFFVQLRARCTRFDSAGWSYPLILSALLRPYHPEEKRSFLLVGRRQPRGTPLIFAAVSPPRRKRLYSFQVARDTLRGSVSARRLSAEADKKREREKKTANREVWEDTTKGRVLDN